MPERSSRRRRVPRERPPSAQRHTLEAPQPTRPYEPTEFSALGVAEDLDRALDASDFRTPTPIQLSAIPIALEGRDIAGCARTGSGKTLAFGVPMLARLAGRESKPQRPRGVVLVPTRELAAQVTEVLAPLGAAIGVKVVATYGGTRRDAQVGLLREGADVVVATPLRLTDLVREGDCFLDAVEILCIDEADRMVDQGFLPQVEWLLRNTAVDRQTMAFSATLDNAIMVLRERWMRDPEHIGVDAPTERVDTMAHLFLQVHEMDRHRVVAALRNGAGRTLVFCNTKRAVDRLVRELVQDGCSAEAIHGDLSQGQRDAALQRFRDTGHAVLVATDVAARGIDVNDVDVVVHFELPTDHKTYLHRAGRTARAGRAGTSVAFVTWNQVVPAGVLQKQLRLNLPIIDVLSNDKRLADVHEFAQSIANAAPPVAKPVTVPYSQRPHRRR